MKRFGVVVAVFAILLFVASSLPSSPSMEELEGTLEIIMATEVAKKTCEPLYFINVNGKRTQFSLPARVPPLSPGQPIKISGRWKEVSGKKSFHCRKVEAIAVAPAAPKTASAINDTSIYLPRQKPVLGEQNLLIVCVDFPGTENNSPVWTEEKISDKIFSNQYSLNAYWKECSGEKVWLTGDILDNGNWKKMPKSWPEYGYGSSTGEREWRSEFQDDMIKLIDPEVDFSKKYDGLIVFRAGKLWKYDYSTVGKTIINTNEGEVKLAISVLNENDIETGIEDDFAAHESGHGLFYLHHANSQSILSGETLLYGDKHDNRGGYRYAQLDTLHRFKLGWLDISQIEIVALSGEYWLDQRELESAGIKLLVIFLKYDVYGEPILYYLEYFKELGEFDSQIFKFHSDDADKDVVLIRKYEEDNQGTSLVYVGSDWNPLDIESSEFCDSAHEKIEKYGFCVQVLEKTETEDKSKSQAKVKITLTSEYSFPTPTPTPTPTPCEADILTVSPPSPLNLKRKTSGEVTVTITNADGCAVAGETVYAEIISAKGKKLISVSPSNRDTDENGQATFTITANKKTGKALVSFHSGGLESLITVKVSKK